jgi:hypothetical protein
MRIAWILSLAYLIVAAPAAEAASPFSWFGFGKQPAATKTTNVSQSSHTPAVFARMAGGTRRMVTNTKNLFTPKKQPVKRQGATTSHSAKKPEPPKQSFFKQLFHPEPPPPPKTVGEWMTLDQVHP